jgi:hypothetical protein
LAKAPTTDAAPETDNETAMAAMASRLDQIEAVLKRAGLVQADEPEAPAEDAPPADEPQA